MRRIAVSVIGSGNVAEALSMALSKCENIELKQIYARNKSRAAELSARCAIATSEQLLPADVYLISVIDTAVASLSSTLPFAEGSLVLHTAGSLSLEAIEWSPRGVLYPMQSFTSGRAVDFRKIPLFLEAESEEVYDRIEVIAHSLSNSVQRLSSEQRCHLHLAAVFVSNFANAMYTAATECAAAGGVSFELFKPAMLETTLKAIDSSDPRQCQTGPAVRGDIPAQRHHLEMLGEDPKAEIYRVISKYIWETSKKI